MSNGLKTRKWSTEDAGLGQGLRADLRHQISGFMIPPAPGHMQLGQRV